MTPRVTLRGELPDARPIVGCLSNFTVCFEGSESVVRSITVGVYADCDLGY